MLLEEIALKEGQTLRQSEFAQYFGHGATGKGIEIRYDDKGQKYLWLFAKEGGRYDDDIGTDRFSYVGEDPQGPGVDDPGNEDQELNRGNEALQEAIDTPLPIFLFFQPLDSKKWEFRGIVEVVSYEYEPQNERYVYTFTLKPIDRPGEREEGGERGGTIALDEEEMVPDAAPPRSKSTRCRIIRNTNVVRELKQAYGCECQACGEKRRRSDAEYAEGHHLRPLGAPHHGPDAAGNVLILCPNHHADFDYGMVHINPDSYELTHAYDEEVNGKELTIDPGHELDARHIRYYNRGIANFD